MKKALCLASCLLLFVGCTPVHTRITKQITVAPAAERSICIQTDPTKPETALIVQPLEAQLASKGYKIVEAPDQAAYTMRLDLIAFGLKGSPPRTYGASMPLGSATGSAVGGATGGLIGFGIGALLSGPSSVPFIGKVDVTITDSAKKEQKTLLTAWARVRKERQEATAREAVATKLAAKIAALMP